MTDVGENYYPHFIKEATEISIKMNLPKLQNPAMSRAARGRQCSSLQIIPATGLRLSCMPVSPKGFKEQRAVTHHLLPQVKNHHSMTQAKE